MKVGVIGFGAMGKNHVRVLCEMPQISVVIVYETNPDITVSGEKTERAASLEELVSKGPEYVVVSLPTEHHRDVAIFLADRCIPVLLEKPVATNLAQAAEISEAFNAARTLCTVGHVERFNPSLSALKKKIEEGVLGEIFQIATRRVGPYPGRVKDVGVGLDLASHDLDLVTWITGCDYSSLRALTSSPLTSKHQDLFLGVGELTNGTLVSHEVNWLTPAKERTTRVLGEHGMLVADSLLAELRFFESGYAGSDWGMYSNLRGVTEGQEIRFFVPVREPLLQEHEAMIDELTAPGSTGIASLEDGVRVLQTLERVLND